MKITAAFIITLLAQTAFGQCLNLSHKDKIAASDIEVTQIGCGQLSRQMFFKGQPIGDASVVDLDSKWKSDSVDDQYETFTRQVRWSWSSDQTKLVYEFFIDCPVSNLRPKTRVCL